MKPIWRIAWREIMLHRVRSLLGMLLIAIPVMLASALAGGWYVDARPLTDPNLQARVSPPDMGHFQQGYDGTNVVLDLSAEELGSDFRQLNTDLLSRTVTPNRVVPIVSSQIVIRKGSGEEFDASQVASIQVEQFDAAAIPGALGIVKGEAPNTGEIVLSNEAAEKLDAKIGDQIAVILGNTTHEVTVTGFTTLYTSYLGNRTINPDLLMGPSSDIQNAGWYVVGSEPVTWDQVKELNLHGSWVESEYVKANPPAPSERYPGVEPYSAFNDNAIAFSIIFRGAVALFVLLVFVLIISPIFYVSANRLSRTLGIAVMNGGEARHLRAAVLLHGLVIGLVGSIYGVLLGIGLLLVRYGGFILLLPALLPIMIATGAFGVIVALIAAYIPARRAAQLTPLEATRDRTTATPSSYQPHYLRVPKWALACFILGFLMLVTLMAMLAWVTKEFSPFAVIGGFQLFGPLGILLMFIGAIGLIPWTLTFIANRLASSGASKLAARDLLRSSKRSFPVAGALVGIVIATTLIVGIVGSIANQSRQDSTQAHPISTVSVQPAVSIVEDTQNRTVMDALAAFDAQATSALGPADIFSSYWGWSADRSYVLLSDAFDTGGPGYCVAPSADGTFAGTDCTQGAVTASPFTVIDSFEGVPAYYGLSDEDAERARAAWEAGGIIMPAHVTREPINTLSFTLGYEDYEELGPDGSGKIRPLTDLSVPVAQVELPNTYEILVPKAVAESWGTEFNHPAEHFLIFEKDITPWDVLTIQRIAQDYDSLLTVTPAQLSPVLAYGSPALVALVSLALFAFLLAIMAMANAELSADYATLYAVGADERTLRSISSREGLILGLVAVIFGIPIGVAPVAFFAASLNPKMLAGIPWLWITAFLVLVPLVTAAAAALTRPRTLTLTRRFE